ncbi:alpha-2-macroglobulin family protein [Bacteroides zoogleoformans]
MGKRLKECSILLLLLTLGLSTLHAQTYDELWKSVKQAQEKSLPKTVIKLTDRIYRKGLQEQNAPQMLKAYVCREKYQEELTPDSLYANLKHMEQWVRTEKNPVNKSILHSLLAYEYAGLMRNNRYALRNRTLLEEAVPDDVREWSTTQFLNKIDEHAIASLQDPIRLLEVSADAYTPFIIQEDGSRFYRHDLYHLLSNRAVSVYEDWSGFDVDSLMQARIHAVYGDMINTYRHRAGMEDAVLLCSLDYWEQQVSGALSRQEMDGSQPQEERVKRHIQALDELIREFGYREVCAEAYIKKAAYLRIGENGRSVAEALKVCDEGLKRYPSYKRINELKNIREGILQPALGVALPESVYPGETVKANVNYRNLKGFTLNVYATAFPEVPRMEYDMKINTYIKQARKHSSTHFDLQPLPKTNKLPEDVPYLASDTLFSVTMPQETGVYIVQLVPDADNIEAEEWFMVATRFKVLTLSLGDGRTEIATLDASTGHPIGGTKVSFYDSHYEEGRKLLKELVTGADGKGILSWQEAIGSYVARKGNDRAMRPQTIYLYRPSRGLSNEKKERITLLTDRSIYRPGQSVYVKGVVYEQDDDSLCARVLEGREYELVLLDVNRKELASRKLRTNDFGSFTTEFVLPAACLNGLFSVQVRSLHSSVSFRVEEYKRPTLEITVNPVAEAYRYGKTVRLTGNVKAFNGMTVQNVPLAYRVTRNLWGPRRPEEKLLADTIMLSADGDFSIPLVLEAPSGRRDLYGNHSNYHVEVTVTDEAGETQTAGYHFEVASEAYLFHVSLPEYICKEDSLHFTFSVNNHNNVPLDVKGTYRLYSLNPVNGKLTAERPVMEGGFMANRLQDFSRWSSLPSGHYSLELSVCDSLDGGEHCEESSKYRVALFSKRDTRPIEATPLFYHKENPEFDAQHPAAFLLGTSCRDAYVLMDVFCEDKRIDSKVLQLNDTIVRMEYPYEARYGEGVTLLFNLVKNGEMYSRQIYLSKRQPAQKLDMKWEVFRDRLRPGQEEEWKLVVKTPQGMPAVAEMLAMMYDASLDKIYKRNQLLEVYYSSKLRMAHRRTSNHETLRLSIHFPMKSLSVPVWMFDRFFIPDVGMRYGYLRSGPAGSVQMKTMSSRALFQEEVSEPVSLVYAEMGNQNMEDVSSEEEKAEENEGQTLQPVADLRTNFAETAFFYPQLRTNEQGEIAFSFTMPQSLTRWNFRGYSHTKDMMTGMMEAAAVTAKEFMLTPNMPRFVRVGDKTKIAASIANLTGQKVQGTATLTLFEPMTEKIIAVQRRDFAVEAGRTVAVDYLVEATERYDLLGVRLVADGGSFSDGEQHLLPVLTNKVYLTETLALPVRGEETRTFSLDSLFNRNNPTAVNRRLTIEFTGNPAWYAVQALPVLSAPTHDNAISWATAYYANSLAGFIANSQPRIKAVFEKWRLAGETKETFLSKLEKNQDVKNILLSESPWLTEAATESERQARIATLFDINQLNNRNSSAFVKLKELQRQDGGWSWCKGMETSRYVTTYITGLLVRLPLLTKNSLPSEVIAMKKQAFIYLHKQALEEYRDIRRSEKKGAKITVNSEAAMNYLYLIALSGEKVPAENQTAYRYFLSKVGANLANGTMVCKAQSAIILNAAGRTTEAGEFIASLKEHLVQTDEKGAHFAFYEHTYGWGMLPVSAHVDAMEALDRIGGNGALVEEMKLWLLKQKQTTAWNSPVATADAVYALLCRGHNLLENRGDVRITLGDEVLETWSPAKTTVPDLGYVKQTYTQGSPALKAKAVTVEKRDAGIAWGAAYAQYLSPMSDVKQHGGELSVEKKLYVERVAADGTKSLQPVTKTTHLSVGDKIVSRLIIRLDRAMDFVHLKDSRGACFEPIGALSGYRWGNGFGYYVEVEDAATNFFFDRLGKGVYVLEHSYRIARGGTYETGLATMQCLYAPEYASHSTGGIIGVE